MKRQLASLLIFTGVVAVALQAQNARRRVNHFNRSDRFHSGHTSVSINGSGSFSFNLPDGLIQQVRVLQGYAIAPVALNLDGKDKELVGLGSYLVNAVGGCNDCHTSPSYLDGGDPYKGQQPVEVNVHGYLGGGQQFGPFTSRNLTPEADADMKPAGMDWDEFLHVMRTGEDTDVQHPQFGPLLQVMPWPTYRNMTDRELRAIYEYLRAIPPVSLQAN